MLMNVADIAVIEFIFNNSQGAAHGHSLHMILCNTEPRCMHALNSFITPSAI
jgi:hypothetical protein